MSEPLSRRFSLVSFASFLLLIFVLGMILQSEYKFLPLLNRITGLALMAIYGLIFLHKHLKIPVEIVLFWGFIGWGVISGGIVAVDQSLFLDNVRTLVQIWGLIWAISGIVALRQDASISFIPLIVSGIIIVGYSFISGDSQLATNKLLGQQTASFLRNPNSMGFYTLLSIVGLLYFWQRIKTTLIKVGVIGLIGLLAIGIIYSGSRKSYLGFLALMLLWLWFCYRYEAFGNWRNFLLVVLITISGYFLTDYSLSATVLGRRMQASIEIGGLDATRMGMYREGWELFIQNPIAGVGFGNFTSYSIFETYSHSDYIEILSTTGIIGFLIYFPIYIILWKRLTRLQKVNIHHEVTYHAGLFKAFLLTLMLLAIGRINYNSVLTWIALAGIIGYVWNLDNTYKQATTQSPTSVRKFSKNETLGNYL